LIVVPTFFVSLLFYWIAYVSHITCGQSSAINATIAVVLLLFSVIACLFSISERFQEMRGTGGLLASSFIVAYTGYLFVDAVSVEPEAWLGACRQESRAWWITVVGCCAILSTLFYEMILVKEKEKIDDDKPLSNMRWSTMHKHALMIGATMYATSVITGWKTFSYSGGVFDPTMLPTVVFVGEIAGAFISIGLYIWYVVAPVVFPDRDFSDEDV
jgi:hypothetical protein